jgi:defect-in-organelle-trafficking protein DotC
MRLRRVGGRIVAVGMVLPVLAAGAATGAGGDGLGALEVPFQQGAAARGRTPTEVAPPPELQVLEQLGPDATLPTDPSASLRYDAMKEVAYTLGVQSAVRWRYGAIGALLKSNQTTLDRVFDFRPLLLHDGRVAPAVIERTDGAYRLVSPTEARQTEATYTIDQEARLISRPPDWRDYLLHSYPTFTKPDPAMLPRNAAERQIWSTAVASGWRAGVLQAERLFDTHLSRLRRDYLGMARFKILALQGIVEVPLLAESRLGVVVNGRMLSVGERLFRIPPVTDFQPVRSWKPILQYIPARPGEAVGGEPGSAPARVNEIPAR